MTSFLPCLGPSRIKPTLKTIQIVPPKPYLAPSLGSQTVYIVISKNWVIIIDLSGLLASPLSARLFRCFCEGYILWANAPQSGEKGQEAVGKGKNGCVQRVLKHHHWRHHRFRGRFSKYDFISSNFICSQNNWGVVVVLRRQTHLSRGRKEWGWLIRYQELHFCGNSGSNEGEGQGYCSRGRTLNVKGEDCWPFLIVYCTCIILIILRSMYNIIFGPLSTWHDGV